MNGNERMTAQLSVGVSANLKQRLKVYAQRQHRSLAGAVRVLLEEAMELEETLDPSRDEFEITLTTQQAARLLKLGYDLQAWEPSAGQLSLL